MWKLKCFTFWHEIGQKHYRERDFFVWLNLIKLSWNFVFFRHFYFLPCRWDFSRGKTFSTTARHFWRQLTIQPKIDSLSIANIQEWRCIECYFSILFICSKFFVRWYSLCRFIGFMEVSCVHSNNNSFVVVIHQKFNYLHETKSVELGLMGKSGETEIATHPLKLFCLELSTFQNKYKNGIKSETKNRNCYSNGRSFFVAQYEQALPTFNTWVPRWNLLFSYDKEAIEF